MHGCTAVSSQDDALLMKTPSSVETEIAGGGKEALCSTEPIIQIAGTGSAWRNSATDRVDSQTAVIRELRML